MAAVRGICTHDIARMRRLLMPLAVAAVGFAIRGVTVRLTLLRRILGGRRWRRIAAAIVIVTTARPI